MKESSLPESAYMTAKSEKEKKMITDLNVDMTVNLQKIKTKEGFHQLKVYAERLKEQLK